MLSMSSHSRNEQVRIAAPLTGRNREAARNHSLFPPPRGVHHRPVRALAVLDERDYAKSAPRLHAQLGAFGRGADHPALPNVVLFLGRLERGKGIFDLLDTISALRGPIPDVRLVCAGDGDLESIARYAKELGIGDVVAFPSWVGPVEKQLLIGRAAVFVLPSYAEGLPMSLLETMAAGLPVVATAVGGIPDVVTDGVNGFLFSSGDTGMLERLLRRLMQDRRLGQRIARAARETVEHHFAADRVVAELE